MNPRIIQPIQKTPHQRNRISYIEQYTLILHFFFFYLSISNLITSLFRSIRISRCVLIGYQPHRLPRPARFSALGLGVDPGFTGPALAL
jgi:hypothetical protein